MCYREYKRNRKRKEGRREAKAKVMRELKKFFRKKVGGKEEVKPQDGRKR